MAGSLALALVGTLVLAAAAAQVAAAKGGGQIGEGWGTPGTGNGQFFNPAMFGADTSTGKVYVGDYNGEVGKEATEYRIQQLTESGEFKAATTIKRFPTAKKGVGLQGIAVDPGLKRFYVVEACRVALGAGNFKCKESGGVFGARNVIAYSTEASGTELVKTATFPLPEGENELYSPTAIAVDPSSHDLLILAEEGEEHLVVQRVSSSGTVGKRFVDSVDALKPIGGGEASSLAVSNAGVAYTVTGASSTGTGAKFTRAFQLSPAMTTLEAVPGFAAQAEKENWPVGHESFVELNFGGPQLAISTDGSTLYWKEARSKSGGPTEPGDLLVRGFSLTKDASVAIWGGGSTRCKIVTSASPLAVTSGGNLAVLDSGAETTKPGSKPAYGLKEMTFGPSGSGCVEPVAKFTINGKKEGEEPTGIKPGDTVTFDASSSELAGGFRKELIWRFGDGSEKVVTEPKEGEEAPATVTHVYSSAVKATVSVEIRLKSPFYGNPVAERSFSVGSPSEAFKLTVSRTGNGTITSSPAGISCGFDCEEEYEKGKVVTLTESPESGSVFKGWFGCESEEELGKKCKVTIGAAKSVSAEFALEQHLLTVTKTGSGTITSSPAGINCGTTCSAPFNHNVEVTLSASPEPGSEFKGWSGACTGTGTCKVTMSAAKSVSAEFSAVPKFKLGVSRSGSGASAGKVTSSPAGINCGADCEEEYEQGTEVTLTPSPEPGSEFKGWSGACTGTGTCKVTMSAAKSVSAEFALEQHTLSVTRTGNGTITSSPAGINCGSTCSAPFSHNIEVTLTPSPEPGSEFKGWSGACTGAGTCKVTMSAAKSVSASFGLERRQLSVTVAGTGSGSVGSSPAGIDCSGGTCSHEYDYGTSVTLSGSSGAKTGPVAWGGCDEIVGANECRVTLTAAKDVVASFPAIGFSPLIVTPTGNGAGKVTSSPAGISCGADCEEEYEQGTEVTLSASPEPGSEFKGWSGACTGTGSCKVTMSAAKSISAEFALEQHTLSVTKTGSGSITSSPAGINCGTTCSVPFNHNVEVTLTPSPEPGSEFKGWSGACTGTGSCKVTMSAAKSVSASFGLEKRQLSVTVAGTGSGTVTSSPAGISCTGGTCSHEYDYGTSVTLSAAPSPGAEFGGWSGACAGTGSCTVTAAEASSVTAIFNVQQHTLAVSETGLGTVSSSPAGINCGTTCSASFDDGTEVTLTPSPEPGAEFKGWSGACTGTGTCKVTMSAAKSVSAEFALEQHTLSVTKTGSGSITSSPAGINCGTTCSAKFAHGTSVTLTATLGPGTEAVTWSGCASEPGPTECTVAMSAAKTVTATFVVEQQQLTVAKTGSGAGTVTSSPAGIDCGLVCAAGFEDGSQVNLTAVADEGSEFKGWSGGGCTGTGGCQVTMSEARSVSAEFARQPGHSLLALHKHGSGSAMITSTPAGVECGGTCETTAFAEGATVTLAVAEFAPHTIEAVTWSGCASEPSPTECSVTLGAATTSVTATFALEQHQLVVAKSGTGTGTVVSAPAKIECGTACSASFDHGSEVTLIAAPADGSEFTGWGGACAGKKGCRVTVDAAKTVSAGFAAIPPEAPEQMPGGSGEEAAGGGSKAEKLKEALKKCKKRKGRARVRCERTARAKASGKAKPKRHPRRHHGGARHRSKGER